MVHVYKNKHSEGKLCIRLDRNYEKNLKSNSQVFDVQAPHLDFENES
jgi:hypothetical protein